MKRPGAEFYICSYYVCIYFCLDPFMRKGWNLFVTDGEYPGGEEVSSLRVGLSRRPGETYAGLG